MTATLLMVAVLCEVGGTLSLRASRGLRRPGWVALTAAAYAVAFSCLALTLRRGLEVGVAYGVWAAVGIVLTALAGRFLLDEPLSPTMVVGIAAILAGVTLVEVGATH